MKGGKGEATVISVESSFRDELATFSSLADERKLDEIIARYPMGESNVFGAIVNALQIGKDKYERLLPALVRDDADLAGKLRQRVQGLSDSIGQPNAESDPSE